MATNPVFDSLTLSTGNFTVALGNATISEGSLTVSVGNISIAAGSLSVGGALITTGLLTANAGAHVGGAALQANDGLLVANGASFNGTGTVAVNSGPLVVNGGSIFLSDGTMTLQGALVQTGTHTVTGAIVLNGTSLVSGALLAANNLSDVASASLSRGNINRGDTSLVTSGATINTDCSLNNVFKATLVSGTGPYTLANPTNLQDGATYIWRIAQPTSGSTQTMTYGTAFKFATPLSNASPPSLTAVLSATDILTGMSDGTSVYVALVNQFS